MRLRDFTDDVKDFRQKFEIDYDGPPRRLPPELASAQLAHLAEELTEYVEATNAGDLVRQFDALVDLVYVALGTARLHGFPFSHGWAAVHRANLQKVRVASAADSKRGTALDVRKPEGWVGPERALAALIACGGESAG